jgi:hypothetical protein
MDSPKYNKTFHVPWSKGCTNDDKKATSVDSLIGIPIIITEKLDGSNASLEHSGCFSRTHSGPPTHASFDLLKSFHAKIKYKIPTGLQLFGENCYALHSIAYSELPGYFLLFNVRDLNYQQPVWVEWQEVQMWAQEIGVPTVPILFKGEIFSELELKKMMQSLMAQPSACGGIREGVVVRVASSFADEEFSSCVMKSVRANHVSPDNDHWKHKEIIKNKLKL